jgi:molecular chaperone DnaK (HSP70)
MTAQTPSFLVGIDLGTTNTVVAYADMSQPLLADNCRIFGIEQLVAPGEVAKRPMLPSFRYHPTPGEISPADLVLPWTNQGSPSTTLAGELAQVVIGEWARELGAKVEGRQVVSAKSWLSHPQVDRAADILPWAAAEGVDKVSPVLASASYLHHVRQAWNLEHPQALLEDQEVVITVPASFDEGARALTVEAARHAGLPNVLLLEEPQAVCYDWYARHNDKATETLATMKLLLVCDIGGGTTDLSLIKIGQDGNGQLTLTRIGVGDHLMLGGDNIDLSLAHIAESNIFGHPEQSTATARKLSAASLSQLIQQTRKAKEKLLSTNAPESARITLLGSGARLIGGARSGELTQAQVKAVALDGFFPVVDFFQRPAKRRSGVVAFGLPYAADPAVSKHLAEFISEHQQVCREALATSDPSQPAIPDAVLFNGGVFNSPILRERVLEILADWRGQSVHCLDNSSPDLAVAQGAVAYARARRGAQLKIGGGSARAFFLALQQAQGQKTPHLQTQDDRPRQAVCLLPKGTEAGLEIVLQDRQFALRLGQPVQFHLLSSNAEQKFQAGELITLDENDGDRQHFVSLPPLIVVLDAAVLDAAPSFASPAPDAAGEPQAVEVRLAAQLTEVGTLQVDCISHDNQRWHVEFEIRQSLSKKRQLTRAATLPPNFAKASEILAQVYRDQKKEKDANAIKTLRTDLEKLLGKRDLWDVPLLRALYDELSGRHKLSRRSATHERNWYNLAGFCLRPGYGYPADDWRIDQIWDSYQQGLQFDQETQSWIDWWNFWRRLAGGLGSERQLCLYRDIARFIDPAALSSRKLQAEAKQKSCEDMIKLAASLEHLPVAEKIRLVDWLLLRLEKSSETVTSWWAVGRIAARVPFHGSAHNVVPKDSVQQWLPRLTAVDWKKNPQAAFAAVLMCRMSGDRERDIDDDVRRMITDKLMGAKVPTSWVEMVETVKELDEAETKRVFGEGLPSGLTLIR